MFRQSNENLCCPGPREAWVGGGEGIGRSRVTVGKRLFYVRAPRSGARRWGVCGEVLSRTAMYGPNRLSRSLTVLGRLPTRHPRGAPGHVCAVYVTPPSRTTIFSPPQTFLTRTARAVGVLRAQSTASSIFTCLRPFRFRHSLTRFAPGEVLFRFRRDTFTAALLVSSPFKGLGMRFFEKFCACGAAVVLFPS